MLFNNKRVGRFSSSPANTMFVSRNEAKKRLLWQPRIDVSTAALFFVLLHSFCFSQTGIPDTIHHLKEVEISANRLQHFSSGNKVEQIDSNALSRNNTNTLADLLADQSQVF